MLWVLLLWRYWKPPSTRSCATCSRWPCFSRGVGLDDPQTSLPTPNILWFCDSVKREMQEVPSEHKETLSSLWRWLTLAQASQRGWELFVLADIQKPAGHAPGKPALGHPAWAGGLDQMTSRGPFEPQTLWFCETAMLVNIIKMLGLFILNHWTCLEVQQCAWERRGATLYLKGVFRHVLWHDQYCRALCNLLFYEVSLALNLDASWGTGGWNHSCHPPVSSLKCLCRAEYS